MSYFLAAMKKYLVFEGRAGVKEFWWFLFIEIVFCFVMGTFDLAMDTNILTKIAINSFTKRFGIFALVYLLATIPPLVTVTVRRLHDIGKPGKWGYFAFIPVIGTIGVLILLCLPGMSGKNTYGLDPRLATIDLE